MSIIGILGVSVSSLCERNIREALDHQGGGGGWEDLLPDTHASVIRGVAVDYNRRVICEIYAQRSDYADPTRYTSMNQPSRI